MTANRVPGQQAAWDTYLAVTEGLLPVLDDFPGSDADAVANHRLGRVVIGIRRYAPMWGEHGLMLIAAAASAVRLYRDGDIIGLRELLQVLARRLYQLSASPATPGKPRNQRHAGPPQVFPLRPSAGPETYDTSDEGTKGLSEDD